MRTKDSLLFIIPMIIAMLGCSNSVPSTPNTTAEPETNESETTSSSPEATLRTFLVAMSTGDAETLKAICVPNDDLELLTMGGKPPADQMDQMLQYFDSLAIQKLTVGESFALPDGSTIVTDTTMVNDNLVLVTFPDNPIPFPLRRMDGSWKVDAGSLIAGRRSVMQLNQ